MRTLVIHPKDETTDFLKEIYRGKDWNVFTGRTASILLWEQIRAHDRIVMLGHGTPSGLLGYFDFVISDKHADLLRTKQLVGIWCNADQFFLRHDLDGFYTGMIISEVAEAEMYDIEASQDEVDQSNTLLADVIGKAIDSPEMLIEAKLGYYDRNNPVIRYNMKNLYDR